MEKNVLCSVVWVPTCNKHSFYVSASEVVEALPELRNSRLVADENIRLCSQRVRFMSHRLYIVHPTTGDNVDELFRLYGGH